jgi:hypothetical protein
MSQLPRPSQVLWVCIYSTTPCNPPRCRCWWSRDHGFPSRRVMYAGSSGREAHREPIDDERNVITVFIKRLLTLGVSLGTSKHAWPSPGLDDKRIVEMTNHSDFRHQANKPKINIHRSAITTFTPPSPPAPITLRSSHRTCHYSQCRPNHTSHWPIPFPPGANATSC